MELTKLKISKLVLGYLKTEKYNRTISMFLEESEEMKEFVEYIKAGKYFGTRVMGMSLVDILEEYSSIYSFVQGPLEASNFYDENRQKTSTPRLLEQIKYLLESNHFGNSSPITASEVDATPMHELPGNMKHADTPKPKKPRSKTSSKSGELNEAFDMSEVFAQSLLDNHELHEKIAETINNVRNTPEVLKPNVQTREEKIGAEATQDLDHVIKEVVERTEEEPLYNKLIDELMGTVPTEPPHKSSHNDFSASQLDKTRSKYDKRTSIEDHNDDAVRSIIEASQQPPPPAPPVTTQSASFTDSAKPSEVIVYDGSLESYLKTAGGGTSAVPSNPVYVSNGAYIVMPQAQPVTTTTVEDPSTIYLVNNQPLLSVAPAVKTITDSDIMTMPTIIVNDDLTSCPAASTPAEKKLLKIAPKMSTAAEEASEFIKITRDPTTTSMDRRRRTVAAKSAPSAPSTSRPQTPPLPMSLPKSSTPRQASHVRNLDFSSPLKMNQMKLSQSVVDKLRNQPAKIESERKAKSAAKRAWDEDLRQGIVMDLPKTPPKKKPKRRGAVNNRSSRAKKAQTEEEEKQKEAPPSEPKAPSPPKEEPKAFNDSTLEQAMELEKNLDFSPTFRCDPKTPLKDTMPKTPGGDALLGNSSLIMKNNCTPFTQVLEEQLKDVDLMAIPTPSLPITPGFALTPNMGGTAYVSRSTDYSTTSSYYQPSDTEHNKSIEQLVEECRTYETKQTAKENFQIISHVVIKPNTEVNDKPMENEVDAIKSTEVPNEACNKAEPNQSCGEILKKFNSNVIGKKNLNLIKSDNETSSSSSSTSSSDSESEKSDDQSNKTVIHKKKKSEDTIRDILKQADYTAAVITDKKPVVSDLEEVRKRTVRKIQSDKSLVKKPRKPPAGRKAPRKAAVPKKKVEKEIVQKTDDEAQKLVDGLRQRGIHLVHNKTPKKIDVIENKPEVLPKTACIEETRKEPSRTTQAICSSNIAPPPDVELPQSDRFEQRNDEPNEFPIFDRVTYETVLEVEHSAQGRRKDLAEYDFALLNKSINAEVYSEDLNIELTRRIHSTCHFTLLDLPMKEKVNMLIPRKTKRSPVDKSATPKVDEDDLMDSVVTGVLNSPEAKSKRRRRTSGEDKQAKKTRQYENNRKLLSNINVDDFLNKLHGGN